VLNLYAAYMVNDRACRTHGKSEESVFKVCYEHLKGRDQLEYLGRTLLSAI
jgi:hypothetical protein